MRAASLRNALLRRPAASVPKKLLQPRIRSSPPSSASSSSSSSSPFRHSFAPAVTQIWQRRSASNNVSDVQRRPPTVGEALIPVIGRLQEVQGLVQNGNKAESLLDLPRIVVLGSQSSGKSSVLENIVGRDFLPRGGGLVTRRPLVLQLHRLTQEQAESRSNRGLPAEWGEFAHKPGKEFTFDNALTGRNSVREEIVAETERLLGKDKAISREPISLHVYSPHVLPLTLVDTPGLTRVPVGDQPADIEHQIRSMLQDFISHENTIILAVSSANQDLATSDSLQMARRVDPEGRRTIGVVTKLDLMDKGTENEGLRILMGERIPLRLGYIGIVNRSQQQIDKDLTIHESLDREREFFTKHPTFSVLANRSGTSYLAATCNQLLSSHIQRALPALRKQVRLALTAKQTELERLGAPVNAKDVASQGWLLLHLINRITEHYKSAINGEAGEEADDGDDDEMKELNGGARLRFVFHDTFARQMDAVDPLQGLTSNDIKTVIRNAAGPRPSLFVPERAFVHLFRRQLELLREPAHRAAELTMDELLRMIWTLESKKNSELGRFPKLRQRVTEIGTATLRDALVPTLEHIDHLLACEAAYINTQHRDFIGRDTMLGRPDEDISSVTQDTPAQPKETSESGGGGGFFSSIFGGGSSKSKQQEAPQQQQQYGQPRTSPHAVPTRLEPGHELSVRDRRQIALLRKLLTSYFDIVRSSIQDSSTKAIMHFLVNRSKHDLHKNLVHELYREDKYAELLQEDPGVAARREAARKQLEALNTAKSLLQEAELLN